MTTFDDIRAEIDRLSERRTDLWQTLSEGRNPAAAAELKEIDERLGRLWDDQRQLRATLRFGERSKIVACARMEERLERAA